MHCELQLYYNDKWLGAQWYVFEEWREFKQNVRRNRRIQKMGFGAVQQEIDRVHHLPISQAEWELGIKTPSNTPLLSYMFEGLGGLVPGAVFMLTGLALFFFVDVEITVLPAREWAMTMKVLSSILILIGVFWAVGVAKNTFSNFTWWRDRRGRRGNLMGCSSFGETSNRR